MARANSGRIVGTLVFGLVLLVLVPTLILGKLFVATFPPGIREVANKKASSVVYFKPQVVAKSESPVADVPAKSIEGSESLIAKDESTPSFTSGPPDRLSRPHCRF